MMKRLLLSVAIVAAGLSGAAAQTTDWSGPYFGLGVGANHLSGGMDAHTPRNGFAGFDLQGVTGTRAGFGVYGGYNWQTGTLVTGLEAEANYVGFNRSTTTSIIEGTVPRFDRKLDTLVAVTPRIGYAQNDFLLFARGGVAVGNFGSVHNQQGTDISGSTSRTGWLIGLGMEYRAAPNMSVRAGVDLMDFGRFRTDVPSAMGTDIYTMQRARVTRATLGLTWHFN